MVSRMADKGGAGSPEVTTVKNLPDRPTRHASDGVPPSFETSASAPVPFESQGRTSSADERLGTSESVEARAPVEGEGRPVVLQLNNEVDLGNGLIFDMRPELPQVKSPD
jgi:hypothetical protein